MNNEFDWWLLIVGLVGGAGLVWLMLSTGRDAPDDPDAEARRAEERQAEADWVAARLSASGMPLDEATAARVLALHDDWESGGGEIDWDWENPSEAAPEREVAVDPAGGDGRVTVAPPVAQGQERHDPPA